MYIPGEQTDELTDLLPHGSGAAAQVVLKQLSDEALQYQDLPDGSVGRQCAQQSDAVARNCGRTAVALGGGCVSTAQHRQGSVLAGCEGGLGGGAG